MRDIVILIAVLLWLTPTDIVAQSDSNSAFVERGAHLTCLFSGGEFTEGPAVSADGRVFFSDLTWASERAVEAGHLWCYDPHTDTTTIYRSPSNMSNGIAFDSEGRMIVAEGAGQGQGARRISRTDLVSGKGEIIASFFEGKPLNAPNDLVLDRQGRIYFTDPRYGEAADIAQPLMGVYRLDPDRSLTLVVRDVPMPNGIAISPDGRTLYVGCYREAEEGKTVQRPDGKGASAMFINAYDLGHDGSVRFQTTLISFSDGIGPDGMAVDVEGNLYVAIRDEVWPRIGIYAPDGSILGQIPLPAVPSNVAFGREPRSTTLYITAGGGLYSIALRKQGLP